MTTYGYMARRCWRAVVVPLAFVLGMLFFLTIIAMRGRKFAGEVFQATRDGIADADLSWRTRVRLLRLRADDLEVAHNLRVNKPVI